MNDEKLSAFLDGELDDTQKQAVAAALAADAGAAARLDLMRRADEVLRQAMAPAPSAADEALAQRLMSAAPLHGVFSASWPGRLAALAAACVFGVWIGTTISARSPSLGEFSAPGSALAAAIESTPSGESQTIAGRTVTMAQTVHTDAGYCRELRISGEDAATDLLACRDGDRWRVVVATPVDESASQYSVASAGQGALDAVLEALGDPALVEDQQERELIRRRWRRDAQTR